MNYLKHSLSASSTATRRRHPLKDFSTGRDLAEALAGAELPPQGSAGLVP
ncbi:MAG TPA: hypothetical protein VGY56_16975 [Verrucomicrobiae bacterium]|nr:hypothetical protein [Verrucomicrobiae bacterium]